MKSANDAHGEPLYSRFSEKHIQRAHSERELVSWLKNIGFENIGVFRHSQRNRRVMKANGFNSRQESPAESANNLCGLLKGPLAKGKHYE